MPGFGNYLEVLQALQQLPQTQQGQAPSPIMAPGPGEVPGGGVPATAPGVDFAALAPPAAPAQPINEEIIKRYLSTIGPAPTAPPPQQMSTIGKIAAALGGFAAGAQGRGAEYANQIRERQAGPQRDYEQRLDTYNRQKAEVGLRGIGAATDDARRREDRITAEADRKFEIDVRNKARAAGIEDQTAFAKFQDAMQAERDAKRAIEDEAKQKRQFDQQNKAKATDLARAYRLAGAGEFSLELAERDAGIRDKVSAGADKWISNKARLDEVRANRAASGGGGGGGRGGGSGEGQGIEAVLSDNRIIPYYRGIGDDIAKGVFGAGITINNIRNRAAGGVSVIDDATVQETIRNAQGQRIPQAEIAAKLRSLPDYAKNKATIEKWIKGYNLEGPTKAGTPAGPDTRPEAERRADLPVNKYIKNFGVRYEQERQKEAGRIPQY